MAETPMAFTSDFEARISHRTTSNGLYCAFTVSASETAEWIPRSSNFPLYADPGLDIHTLPAPSSGVFWFPGPPGNILRRECRCGGYEVQTLFYPLHQL